MAPDDAEMPSHYKLRDDLSQLKKDVAGLRGDVEGMAGNVAATGSNQLDNLQAVITGAVAGVEASVKRNPLNALAIAAGIGFLYGILTRR